MGGELMVLGFLAFLVWTFNQAGGFDRVAEATASSARLPTSGPDYLHMMEAVHMHLFLGMVAYFGVLAVVVRGGMAQNRLWEGNWKQVKAMYQRLGGGRPSQEELEQMPPAL